MKGFRAVLLQVLFPPRCFLCDDVVPIRQVVCVRCQAKSLLGDSALLCQVCGKPKPDCVCGWERFAFARCISAFAYQKGAVEAIKEIKEKATSPLLGVMGSLMVQALQTQMPSNTLTCVTFVPMQVEKQHLRGHNQAETLARVVAQLLELPLVTPPIERTADGTAQHLLKAAERKHNVELAYQPTQNQIQGQVLLVDDVATTGATLQRCASILMERGASVVYCLTAATTLRRAEESNIE